MRGKPRRRRASSDCLRDLRSLSVNGAEDVTSGEYQLSETVGTTTDTLRRV